MNKRIRFLTGSLVLLFSLLAIGARAQSAVQAISFSVTGEYQTVTNDVPTDPTVTHEYFHLVLFNSGNVVKAIAADKFGKPAWTNWIGSTLVRRVNLVTGEEGIFLRNGTTNEADVSSFFSGSSDSNFTRGLASAFPAATNNFDASNPNPLEPIYSGMPTNHHAYAGLHFISVTTTNLKMNLVGSSFGGLGLGLGVLNRFSGVEHGTNYSGELPNDIYTVVGSFSWTPNTNIFGVSASTNTFYSGPAHGSVTFKVPTFSPRALPPTTTD